MSNAPKPPAASGPRNPLDAPVGGLPPGSKLSDDARGLLKPEKPVGTGIEDLAAAGLLLDAIRVMAQALPRREAVWWACACLRDVAAPTDPPPEKAALDAAVRWVAAPTEEHRRAAFAAAEAVEFGPPAANAALAAFWSGGSMSLPSLPPAPPPPHLLPTAVANAVVLAGVKPDPAKAAARHAAFLALGREVAAGKNRWPEPPPAAPAARPVPGKR